MKVTGEILGRGKSRSAGMGKEDEVEGREMVKEEGIFQGEIERGQILGLGGKLGQSQDGDWRRRELGETGVGRQGSEKVRGGAVGGGTAFRQRRQESWTQITRDQGKGRRRSRRRAQRRRWRRRRRRLVSFLDLP